MNLNQRADHRIFESGGIEFKNTPEPQLCRKFSFVGQVVANQDQMTGLEKGFDKEKPDIGQVNRHWTGEQASYYDPWM